MEVPVASGKAHAPVRPLLDPKETRQFVIGELRGHVEKRTQMRLGDQDVVFRVDEDFVFVGALGKERLVRERQRPRVLARQPDPHLDIRSKFLVDVGQDDNVDVERHRAIFIEELREIAVVAAAVARNRDEDPRAYVLMGIPVRPGDAACRASFGSSIADLPLPPPCAGSPGPFPGMMSSFKLMTQQPKASRM